MATLTSAASETARALRVRARADAAAHVIAPYYGLDAAIAVNPVLSSLGEGFAAAISHAAPAVGGRGVLDERAFRQHLASGRIAVAELAASIRRRSALSDDTRSDLVVVRAFLASRAVDDRAAPHPSGMSVVDERVARWCAAAFAPEAAAWPVPVGQKGFYGAWRAIARHDLTLPQSVRRRINELPQAADVVVVRVLDLLHIAEDDQRGFLQAHLAALPGWTAYVRWRAMTHRDVEVLDLLAVRLTLAWALDAPWSGTAPPVVSRPDDLERALVWQEAFEAAPHAAVLEKLDTHTRSSEAAVRAHLVFCIDPRSEGLRRHLEAQGGYATSGFAGFFGIAAAVEPIAAREAVPSCPVLLSPRYQVAERPRPSTWRATASLIDRLTTRRAARGLAKAPEALAGAPLGWAEVSGWLLGPSAIARSVLAGRGVRPARPDDESAPTLFDIDSALTLDDQVDTAEVIVRTMGMVENFAPLIVLVGHGTSTTNNVFRTALDCGACGGHRGAPNARIAAALLSSPEVRAGLAERGISIPAQTLVMAAEHDTATDTLTVFDTDGLAAPAREVVTQLARDAEVAGRALATERARELPGAGSGDRAGQNISRRASDWAQVYPEWGLARNAALIIAPRSMSAGADLHRRAFLHSYSPDHDADGVALETILTAPLVVAHWINAQYYFSAVDPDVFGAGTKTVHNLVGGAGVLSGPSGDLRLGLPWQSIGTRSGLHHEPVRLLVVVDAPRERIDGIIERADIVADLVHGEWVVLVRPGREHRTWERRTPAGWQPWTPAGTSSASTRKDAA